MLDLPNPIGISTPPGFPALVSPATISPAVVSNRGMASAMHPDTRHKAIIGIAAFIAVGVYFVNDENFQKAVIGFFVAFAGLYAAYFALHALGWVLFSGERGTGLRLVPRTGNGIAWGFRGLFRSIGTVSGWGWQGVQYAVRAVRNSQARRQWEKGRPERERQAAEAARIEAARQQAERQRIEEEKRLQKLAEDEAHKLRVEREAEITAARTKAEAQVRLDMQAEANRLAREHEEHMLSIEQERLAIAEKRGERHAALLNTLSGLVDKSKE